MDLLSQLIIQVVDPLKGRDGVSGPLFKVVGPLFYVPFLVQIGFKFTPRPPQSFNIPKRDVLRLASRTYEFYDAAILRLCMAGTRIATALAMVLLKAMIIQ